MNEELTPQQEAWELGFADGSQQTYWEMIEVIDQWLAQKNLPPENLRDRLYMFAKLNKIQAL